MSSSLDSRVSELETALKDLAYAQFRADYRVEKMAAKVDALSEREDTTAELRAATDARIAAMAEREEAAAELRAATDTRIAEMAEREKAAAELRAATDTRIAEMAEREKAAAELRAATDARIAEMTAAVDRMAAKVDALSEREDTTAELRAATDARIAAMAASRAEGEARLTKIEALVAETSLALQETRTSLAESAASTSNDYKEMNKKWGELANKMGTIVEDIVAPNIPGILRRHFGVAEPEFFAVRIRRKHPTESDRTREYDAFSVGAGTIFVNETKSTIRMSDVETFAGTYREVLEFFPEFADYKVVPIMSSLHIPPEILSALTAKGIFALAMGDETMELLNADELGRPAV